MTALLVSALLLAQPEVPPSDPPPPSSDALRISAEIAGGVLLGSVGAVGGVLVPCSLDSSPDGCLGAFWFGYPIGLFLGTGVGVLLVSSWFGDRGSTGMAWMGAAVGALASVFLGLVVSPYLALTGPLFSTAASVILFELTHPSRWEDRAPLHRPAPFTLSVQVDPRGRGLALRGTF
jgi:MFS family permease